MWSLDVNAACTRLVTGASDNQLRVWALEIEDGGNPDEGTRGGSRAGKGGGEDNGDEEGNEDVVAVYMGSVVRQGNGAVGQEEKN